VALLAVLLFALAALLALSLTERHQVSRILGLTGARSWLWPLLTGGLALLAGVTALGLYAGFGWGWWLIGVISLYFALQHLLVLVVLPELSRQFGRDEQGMELLVLEQLGRAVGWFLLVVYLHTPAVIDYFDLHGLRRKMTLLGQSAAAAALVFVASLAWVV
jgi:hypothetical protein